VLLPIVVALVPLVITPGLLFYFDVTPKIALLTLGVAAALPWFAPRKLLAWRGGRWLCALLGAQAFSLVLSTVFSSRVGLSTFGTNWRRFGLITQMALLLFTALAAVDMADGARRYLRATVAAAVPISLYGIAQYFGWDPWIPKQAYHVGEGIWTIVRPPGTLGYVSYFANYLVFAVFLSAGLYRLEPAGWWKSAAAASAALATCALILSGTRAGLLAIVVGAIFLWLWFGWRIRMRVVALASAGLIALALFYYSPPGQMLRSRTRWYIEDTRGGARFWLWRDSVTLARRHGLVGFGPETFASEFPRVQSAALAKAYPDFYQESAHNIFLDALTAQGLLGLLVLAGFAALGFDSAWKARKTEPVLAGILGACLAAGLVAHLFTVFTLPTALYFYLTVAMLVSLPWTGGADPLVRGRPPGRLAARPTKADDGVGSGPGGPPHLVAALPISATLVVFAIRLLVADHMMVRVQAGLNAVKPIDAARAYQRVRNWGLNSDLWYSRQAVVASSKALDPVTALTAWQQALESGFRAARTAEDPHNAWYHLATLYARQNDFDRTEQCLRTAITCSPNWFKPHWMLAQVLLMRHPGKDALAEAALASDLNAGKNPEVARTLAQIVAQGE